MSYSEFNYRWPRVVRVSVLAVLFGCAASCAQLHHGPVGFWSRNRYDRSGDLRQGPWRGYFDAAEACLANRGRYRHGRQVGMWRYYAPTGELEHTERFQRPAGLVTLSYYHPNGQLAKRGQAQYRQLPDGFHFFWFGEWKCYSTTGEPIPSEFYRNGHKLATLLVTPAGDTLAP